MRLLAGLRDHIQEPHDHGGKGDNQHIGVRSAPVPDKIGPVAAVPTDAVQAVKHIKLWEKSAIRVQGKFITKVTC